MILEGFEVCLLPLGGGAGGEGQAAVHEGVLREVALQLWDGPVGDRRL